jgi:hypothetical protein
MTGSFFASPPCLHDAPVLHQLCAGVSMTGRRARSRRCGPHRRTARRPLRAAGYDDLGAISLDPVSMNLGGGLGFWRFRPIYRRFWPIYRWFRPVFNFFLPNFKIQIQTDFRPIFTKFVIFGVTGEDRFWGSKWYFNPCVTLVVHILTSKTCLVQSTFVSFPSFSLIRWIRCSLRSPIQQSLICFQRSVGRWYCTKWDSWWLLQGREGRGWIVQLITQILHPLKRWRSYLAWRVRSSLSLWNDRVRWQQNSSHCTIFSGVFWLVWRVVRQFFWNRNNLL